MCTLVSLCDLRAVHQAARLCASFLSILLLSRSFFRASSHVFRGIPAGTLSPTSKCLKRLNQLFLSSFYILLRNHRYACSYYFTGTFSSESVSYFLTCLAISYNSIAHTPHHVLFIAIQHFHITIFYRPSFSTIKYCIPYA